MYDDDTVTSQRMCVCVDSDGKNAPPAEVRVVVELVGVSMPGPGSSLVIKVCSVMFISTQQILVF